MGRKTPNYHYSELLVVISYKLITFTTPSYLLVEKLIIPPLLLRTTMTFGFPSGPVSVLRPTLACHRTCSESGHIETSQKCVLTTQGITWKWKFWPRGSPTDIMTKRVPLLQEWGAGRRVDLVSKWVKLWLSKEHKNLGTSWHSSPFLHFRTSRTASFTPSVPQEKHIHNPSLIHAIHDANTRCYFEALDRWPVLAMHFLRSPSDPRTAHDMLTAVNLQ